MNLSIANQGYWCEGWKIWITLLHFIWDICELSFPLESKRNICLINLFYCLVMLLSNADIDIWMVIPSIQFLPLFFISPSKSINISLFQFPLIAQPNPHRNPYPFNFNFHKSYLEPRYFDVSIQARYFYKKNYIIFIPFIRYQ